MSRMLDMYRKEIAPALRERFAYKSVMQVPRLTSISLNMGVGEAVGDKEALNHAMNDMALISGQRPVRTNARKSVAGFKIRAGWPIGCKVTLRGRRMYEFLDRLINVAIPRMRDFRGISPNSFDRRGNFSMGITEQIIFPEIDYDKTDKLRGMNIVIITTAKNDEEARALLSGFRMPFRRLPGADQEAENHG